MEFPPVWTVLPAEQFETAAAPNTAAHTMQLLVQLRPSGRILDGFQVKLGGTRILNAEVDMSALIPAATFKSWKLSFQFWPHDVAIRQNMLSSAWTDVSALISTNDATVVDDQGQGVSNRLFLSRLADAVEHEPEAASLRWAVTVGCDLLPKLQLQGLPEAAALLSRKHQFKG
jgi:hypothetical protein